MEQGRKENQINFYELVVSAMGNQGSKCPWKSCIIRSVLLKDREDGDFIDHLLGH